MGLVPIALFFAGLLLLGSGLTVPPHEPTRAHRIRLWLGAVLMVLAVIFGPVENPGPFFAQGDSSDSWDR